MMAWNACISQTAVLYSYRANTLHRDAAKLNRKGAQRMALCFTHEAMLFSTQNIHLENAGRVQQESKKYQQGQVGKGNVNERDNSKGCQDVSICSRECEAF